MARLRLKKKDDLDYWRKESKRVEQIRKKKVKVLSPRELAKYRNAAALRKRNSRQNLATMVRCDKKGSYKSPQGLKKAIKKTAHSLPKSPRKKREVVRSLADVVGLHTDQSMSMAKVAGPHEMTVKDFFHHPDVAYTAPGMKDEVTVWENGVKYKLRKYYLTMFLKEAFALFTEFHPEITIGFSTFAKLRPRNVLLLKDTPADQCKCMKHENFMLKLAGLGVIYGNEWWKSMLCNSEKHHEKCWKGECEMCGVHKLQLSFLNSNKAETVKWTTWGREDSGRLKKIMKTGCRGELEELTMCDMPDFQEHVRVKRVQAMSFESKKQETKVIQMDFAMSYSCEYQHEIQSALWSRESVTLFTAAMFYNGNCSSHLIVSDSTEKDKNTIFAFVHYLLERCLHQDMTGITFFTDGPSGEFKNKFMAKLMVILASKYGMDIEWQYFATSHGKGVVDGIGGRAKSLVRHAVMSKRPDAPVVQNSKDFAKLAEKLMPQTHVHHISQKEIDAAIKHAQPWQDTIPVPGISKVHRMKADALSAVNFWRTAGVDEVAMSLQYPPVEQHLEVAMGDWVIVKYDDDVYPGEVVGIVGQETEVKVMHKSGSFWKWPEVPDILFYKIETVVQKVAAPQVAGSRGQFKFADF